MISALFFLATLFALSVAQVTLTPALGQPNSLGGGDSTALGRLLSDQFGTVSFDLTVTPAGRAVRVLRIGIALDTTPTSIVPLTLLDVRLKAGGRTSTNAFQQLPLTPFVCPSAACQIIAPIAPATATVYLIDVTDFVLTGITNIALTLPTNPNNARFVYEAVLDTVVFSTGGASALEARNATHQSSAFAAVPSNDVSGAHEPNVQIEFTDAISLNLVSDGVANARVVSSDAVVAGSVGIPAPAGVDLNNNAVPAQPLSLPGRDNLVFRTTLTNNGFEFVPSVDVRETLILPTLPPGTVTFDRRVFNTTVTGCVWRVQSFTAAVPPATLTDAETAINTGTAASAVPASPPFAAGDTGSINLGPDKNRGEFEGDAALTTVVGAYQMRSSVFVAGATPARLGLFSTIFVPRGFAECFTGVPNCQATSFAITGTVNANIRVYIDGVQVPEASWDLGLPDNSAVVPPPGEPTFWYTRTALLTPGTTHNVRIVAFVPAGTARVVDLELVSTVLAAPAAPAQDFLDDRWGLLLPGSFVLPVTPTFSLTTPPALPASPGGIINFQQLCVGGTVTFDTFVNVASDAARGFDVITQSATVDTFATPFVLTPQPTVVNLIDVLHEFALAVTKTSVCDTSIETEWNTRLWLVDENTLTNNTSPFFDLDTFVSGLTPSFTDQFDVLDFGGTPADTGTNGLANEFPGFPFAGGVAPTNFFVRATGRISVSVAGIYTIATVENRGVRVKVDGVTVIERQPPSGGLNENFVAVQLSAGVHDVIVDYYDVNGPSVLEVFFAVGGEPLLQGGLGGTLPSLLAPLSTTLSYALLHTVSQCQQQCDANLFSGYSVQMWRGTTASLSTGVSPIQDIDQLVANGTAPDSTRCGVEFLNYDLNTPSTTGAPTYLNRAPFDATRVRPNEFQYPLFQDTGVAADGQLFYFRATGTFYIAQAGNYTFAVSSNRGVRVKIDDTTVILYEPAAPFPITADDQFATLTLTQGPHSIDVAHYYDGANNLLAPPPADRPVLEVMIAPGGLQTPTSSGIPPASIDPFDASFPASFLPFALLGTALECQLTPPVESVVAGTNFTYTVSVRNDGPSKADRINVNDVLTLAGVPVPTAGIFISGLRVQDISDTTNPSALPFNSPLTWTINDLLFGDTARLFIDVSVPSNTLPTPALNGLCDTVTPTTPLLPLSLPQETITNPPASVVRCEEIRRIVDLQRSVLATTTSVVAGAGQVTFVVTVKNNGPSDAAGGFSLSNFLTLPVGTSFTSALGMNSGSFNPATFTWTGPAPFAAGQSATLNITVTAAANAVAALNAIRSNTTNIVLLGTPANGETLIQKCDDGSLVRSVTITREFDLGVSKVQTAPLGNGPNVSCLAFSPNEVVAGLGGAGNLRYRVTITNLGPSDASTLQIVDSLIGAPATGITVDSFTPSAGTFANSLCNGGTASSWDVRVWSNALTVAQLTAPDLETPFDDFDNVVRFTPPTTVANPPPQTLNFQDNNMASTYPGAVAFPGIAAGGDNFFLYANGTLNVVSGGVFTFATVNDQGSDNDGVRVAIDGVVVIDYQPPSAMAPTLSPINFHTVNLTTGAHQFEVTYYHTTGNAKLQVLVRPGSFANPVATSTMFAAGPLASEFTFLRTAPSCLFACASPLRTLWRVDMYQSNSATLVNGVSAFEDLDAILDANQRPNATGSFDVINFADGFVGSFTGAAPNTDNAYPLGTGISNFFLNAQAQIFITEAGTYRFRVNTITGARVILDGQTIIEFQPDNPPFQGSPVHALVLAAGAHDIEVGHYGTTVGSSGLEVTIERLDSPVAQQLLLTSRYCQVPTWSLTTLPVGASVTLDLNLTVASNALIGTITNNIFYAIATADRERIVDTNGVPSEAQVVTNVMRNVALTLTKVQRTPAANAPVVAGSGTNNLQYTITIVNNGPSDTVGVNVTDLLTLPTPRTATQFSLPTITGVGIDGVTALPAVNNLPAFALDAGNPATGFNGLTAFQTPPIPAGRNVTYTLSVTVTRDAFCRAGNNNINNTVSVSNLVDGCERPTPPAVAPPVVTTFVNRVVDIVVKVTRSTPTVLAVDDGFVGTIASTNPRCVNFDVTVTNAGPSTIDVVDIVNDFTLPHDAYIERIEWLDLPPAPPPPVGVFTTTSTPTVPATLRLQGADATLRFAQPANTPLSSDTTAGANDRQARIRVCTTSAAPETFESIVDTVSFTNAVGACEIIANTTDDIAQQRVSVQREIKIGLNKAPFVDPQTPAPNPAIAGQFEGNVPFQVTVTNSGPSDATNVVIADRPDLATTGSRVYRFAPGREDEGWDVEVYLSAANITTLAQAAAVAASPANLFAAFNADSVNFNGLTDLFDASTNAVLNALGVTENVVVKARTQFFVSSGGTFTFALTAKDGAAVSIDAVANAVAIDGTRDNPVTALSAPLALVAGAHNADVLYFLRKDTPRLTVEVSPGAVPFYPLGAFTPIQGLAPTTYTPLNAQDGQWTLPVLREGETAQFLVFYTVPTNATTSISAPFKQVTNNVTLVHADEQFPLAPATTATAQYPVQRLCTSNEIKLTLSRNVAVATAGASLPNNVVHTITVRNVGPSQCDNIVVTTTASGITGVSTTHVAGAQPAFTLASGATKTIVVNYNVAPNAADSTAPVNAALDVVTAAQITAGISNAPQPVPAATIRTQVQRFVNLVLTKTADVDTVRQSCIPADPVNCPVSTQVVTYTLTLVNHGPSDATSVTIRDVVACKPTDADCEITLPALSPLSLNPVTNTITWGPIPAALTEAGDTVSQSFTVRTEETTETGIGKITDTAEFIAPFVEQGTRSAPVTVSTAVAPFSVIFAFNAFEQGGDDRKRSIEAYHSSSSLSSSSSSNGRCTSTSHPADECTRLIFLEVTNTDTLFRATNVKVSVTIDNVALAEALLTQSSRDDLVVSNGGGVFTWTIASLQAGQRTRLAFKVRTIAERNQITARIEDANACLPTSPVCLFPANAAVFTTFTKIL